MLESPAFANACYATGRGEYVNQLQEQINDMQSTLESLSDLSDRFDILENDVNNYFLTNNEAQTSEEIEDLSDRVEALEQTNNDFFGA